MQLDENLKAALIDALHHITFGTFVNLPIVIKKPAYIIAVIIFSMLLDTDHVIQARSLSVKKMLNLGGRPAFHSLLIVVLITLLTYIPAKSITFSAVAFLSMLSHLIWDLATGGVNLLFPLKKIYRLTKVQAVFAFVLLFGISLSLL